MAISSSYIHNLRDSLENSITNNKNVLEELISECNNMLDTIDELDVGWKSQYSKGFIETLTEKCETIKSNEISDRFNQLTNTKVTISQVGYFDGEE